MKTRKHVVEGLLRVLVDAWGYDVVREALNDIDDRSSLAPDMQFAKRSGGHFRMTSPNGEPRGRSRRQSAVEQAEKMPLPDDRKALILTLATRFDKRMFLPTASDVRNFLEINHATAGVLHGREAALPKVFRVLVELPDETLGKIVRDDSYSGPSRLGPLSDAIQASRTAIRSNEER